MPSDNTQTPPTIKTVEVPDPSTQGPPVTTQPQPAPAVGGGGPSDIAATQDPTFGTIPTAGANLPPVITTPTSGGGKRKWLFAGIAGILFLSIAVTAGVLLTQMNQNPQEQAATADLFCGNVNDQTNIDPRCKPENFCWYATTVNQCLKNGQPEGSTEYFGGNGTWDGQVCYTCDENSDEPNTVKCSAGTQVGGNPALCPGGGTQPPATEPPAQSKAVCGESCSNNSDCADATIPGVTVVCRKGKCVNKACDDRGGNTTFGTRCDCDKPTGLCGENCGAAIGLCDASKGLTCTYLAQSQCSPNTRWPVCVPVGTNANARGPMQGVPTYQDAAFERKRCGNNTSDPDNNYIYHPAFANGLTKAQVDQYICNPETPPGLSGQCVSVLVYDTSWKLLDATAQSKLRPGDKIRVTVNGSATQGALDQARFTFNGTLRDPVTQKKPDTEEFYDEITIPAGATSIKIKGQLHHPTLGWF